MFHRRRSLTSLANTRLLHAAYSKKQALMARARSKTRSPEILANELIQHFSSGDLPVDVEHIARKLHCIVSRYGLKPNISGLLIREQGQVVIAVNPNDAPVRQRFTIAHEIGHLVMHPGRPLLVDADVRVNLRTPTAGFATELEETQANQFAAALLMPAERVRKEVDKIRRVRRDANPDVESLALRFGVSSAAMQYRLINLGLSLG
jgi:Zn-dependent peptidase ImmA (M78 family)